MEAAGIEPPQQNAGNIAVAPQSGAKSGALSTDSARIDADLAALIDSWPTLPVAVKGRIMAMVARPPLLGRANGPWGVVVMPDRRIP
jgi:hypothetical protein